MGAFWRKPRRIDAGLAKQKVDESICGTQPKGRDTAHPHTLRHARLPVCRRCGRFAPWKRWNWKMSFSSTFLMPKRWSPKGTTIKAPGRPAQARTQSAGPAGAALIVDTHRTPAPKLVADDGAAGERLASTYLKVCCPHTEHKARGFRCDDRGGCCAPDDHCPQRDRNALPYGSC